MPTVRSADGVVIAYRSIGNAPPTLVFMHGWAGSGAYFDLLLDQLDLSRVQAITYDIRGHGESADSDDGYSLDGIAADAIAVADAVGAETFVLVGFSMSGKFAQYISCLHPDRVLGQVLVAGAPAGEMPLPVEVLEDWYAREGSADRMIELTQSFMTEPVDSAVLERFGRDAARIRRVALEGTANAVASTSFADRLAMCQTPTLVVGGTHDPMFTVDVLRDAIASPLLNARVELLECGHDIPIERPIELA